MLKAKATAPTNEDSERGPAASLARTTPSFAVALRNSRLGSLQAAIDNSPRQLAQRRHIDSLFGSGVLQRQVGAPPRDGVKVNDDAGLERKADVMGSKAAGMATHPVRQRETPLIQPVGIMQLVRINTYKKDSPHESY